MPNLARCHTEFPKNSNIEKATTDPDVGINIVFNSRHWREIRIRDLKPHGEIGVPLLGFGGVCGEWSLRVSLHDGKGESARLDVYALGRCRDGVILNPRHSDDETVVAVVQRPWSYLTKISRISKRTLTFSVCVAPPSYYDPLIFLDFQTGL